MSVSDGMYTPFTPCPDRLRTWDEHGKRIATIEKINGNLVAIPYYGPGSGLHDAGDLGMKKDNDSTSMISVLSGTTAGEHTKVQNGGERKKSFLQRLFQGKKDKEVVVDHTHGVNRPAAIRHGNLAKSIYD